MMRQLPVPSERCTEQDRSQGEREAWKPVFPIQGEGIVTVVGQVYTQLFFPPGASAPYSGHTTDQEIVHQYPSPQPGTAVGRRRAAL